MNLHHATPSQELTDLGALIYSGDEIPLSGREWQTLRQLVEEADYDHVVAGDADEAHSVRVARFVNDVDKPRDESPLAGEIRRIVMSGPMREFYSSFTGQENLCMRRCQANLLRAGDYIGTHTDQDSNPDYLVTIVFHFDTQYDGGDFVSHHDVHGDSRYHPPPFSILVNNCEVPHEVTPVLGGERLTLACFLSREFGDSPVRRKPVRLSY